MNQHREVLADRLNGEPNVFKGCSTTELGLIVGVAILVWLPVSVLIAWAMGAPSMGLGLAGVAIVLSVIIAAGLMQRLKRGRPDSYYRHAATLALARTGLVRSPYICRDGEWSLGRQWPTARS